jgi:hypothetical protein
MRDLAASAGPSAWVLVVMSEQQPSPPSQFTKAHDHVIEVRYVDALKPSYTCKAKAPLGSTAL